jgi:hypothetical protein
MCTEGEKSKVQGVDGIPEGVMGRPGMKSLEARVFRGELNVEEIQNQIDRSSFRWFGHVKRLDEHRIPKMLLEMKMSVRRPRGRPCTWNRPS